MSPAEQRPWFEEAFRAEYRAVYPHRDLAAAREEMALLAGRGVTGRILDLGCGFGRHVLALREAGREAVGVDLSAELLALAQTLPGSDAVAGRLARADSRALPFARGSFETVLLLFSSFGYLDELGDARVLEEVARVLRIGGMGVFDLMNPARIRAGLVPESEAERGGFRIRERRRLADRGRRVVKEVRLVRLSDGFERTWREDVRLYEPGELGALSARAGLEVVRTEGDFDGSALGPRSPRQIVWARRGGLQAG